MKNVKKNLSELLKACAARGQHGQSVTPRNFYVGRSYSAYYWSGCSDLCDFEAWQAMDRLSSRYKRLVEYCEEVLPEWEETKLVKYWDNSVESVQVSRKLARIRRVLVTAPWGDPC